MKVPRDADGLDDSMRSKFVGSWVWVTWMGQDGDAKFCEDARMMFFFLPSWMIFFF